MRIIISAIHYPVASGRYMTDAFRRLGHDVRTLGDSTGNRIPWPLGKKDGTWNDWTELDPKYAWASDGDLTKHWPDWIPDLIVHMDSSFKYHHPVYTDVPHVVYGVDNHVRDYRQAGIARYFLAHKNVSVMDWAAPQFVVDSLEGNWAANVYHPDNTDMEWLPCAYDPQWFTPSPIPWEQREYDVCLVGALYPQRIVLLSALLKAGLSVLAATGAVYDQYAKAYQNSRISLCVSAAGDVAQRVFETAAMGCVILSDDCPDFSELGLEKFDGIQRYKSVDDAVELAKYLATDMHAGEAHASECQAWALPHTWDARAERIVEWWEQTYGVEQSGGLAQERANIDGENHEQPGTNTAIETIIPASEAPLPATEEARTHEEDLRHVEPTRGVDAIDLDLDSIIHEPVEIEELPEPEKKPRKKRGH